MRRFSGLFHRDQQGELAMASRVLQELELEVLARVRVLEVGVVKVGLTVVEELEVGEGEDGVIVRDGCKRRLSKQVAICTKRKDGEMPNE